MRGANAGICPLSGRGGLIVVLVGFDGAREMLTLQAFPAKAVFGIPRSQYTEWFDGCPK